MSKPRYWWFGTVKAMLYRYPDGLMIDTVKGAEAFICIRKALEETKAARDGPERVKLIEMVFIKKTKMVYGAAAVMHVSESTAKRWVSEFVYLVAGKMGYL